MNVPSLINTNWNQDPFRRLNQMQREMEQFFQGMEPNNHAFLPACEVRNKDDRYLISMDIPGMKKDEIKVELNGNLLSVSGERKSEKEEKKDGQYRSERSYGYFERSFTVPDQIKAEQITSEYKDGVLNISVPKDQKKTQSIRIS